jgi:thiamine pyrophosphate-dependent acetolactate synthase large subunit-like protein
MVERLKTEIIVTSAGNSSEIWWDMTHESERVFYLEASMSLASLFAAGIALGNKEKTVVAINGDGAFAMNPGMLLVEKQLDLPNLKHFVLSNGCYGSTNDLTMPFTQFIDYAGMARAAGLSRVYSITSVQELQGEIDTIVNERGHTFTVLHVEPLGRHLPSPPLDGPEVKFRFGRYLERNGCRPIFVTPLT